MWHLLLLRVVDSICRERFEIFTRKSVEMAGQLAKAQSRRTYYSDRDGAQLGSRLPVVIFFIRDLAMPVNGEKRDSPESRFRFVRIN